MRKEGHFTGSFAGLQRVGSAGVAGGGVWAEYGMLLLQSSNMTKGLS
jgi:hypothetical protein